MVFEWEYTNIKHLRPVWPQIASKFKDRFQFRVGQICHSSEKCELCFIGLVFTIFKIITRKPTKFPLDHHITCLYGIHTTLDIINNGSVKIFSPHPVHILNILQRAYFLKLEQRCGQPVYLVPQNLGLSYIHCSIMLPYFTKTGLSIKFESFLATIWHGLFK